MGLNEIVDKHPFNSDCNFFKSEKKRNDYRNIAERKYQLYQNQSIYYHQLILLYLRKNNYRTSFLPVSSYYVKLAQLHTVI